MGKTWEWRSLQASDVEAFSRCWQVPSDAQGAPTHAAMGTNQGPGEPLPRPFQPALGAATTALGRASSNCCCCEWIISPQSTLGSLFSVEPSIPPQGNRTKTQRLFFQAENWIQLAFCILFYLIHMAWIKQLNEMFFFFFFLRLIHQCFQNKMSEKLT